jgi:hypothetical protein
MKSFTMLQNMGDLKILNMLFFEFIFFGDSII